MKKIILLITFSVLSFSLAYSQAKDNLFFNIRENAYHNNDDDKPLPFEHLPLVNTIIHHPYKFTQFFKYYYHNVCVQTPYGTNCMMVQDINPHIDCNNSEFNYYKDLLNAAPDCFTNSYEGENYITTNRLIWPYRGENSDDYREYNGLDYMMLHNLFYIVFSKEDYTKITINAPYTNITQSVLAGEIEANNEISGGKVTYQATTKQVSLKPGFRAGDGVEFSAKVLLNEGCYNGKNYRILDVNQCYENKSIISQTTDRTTNPNKNINKMSANDSSYQSLADSEINIDIYPNPADRFVTIEIKQFTKENTNSKKVVTLYDCMGRNLINKTIQDDFIDLDIRNLYPGLYVLHVIVNDKIFYNQIIKN